MLVFSLAVFLLLQKIRNVETPNLLRFVDAHKKNVVQKFLKSHAVVKIIVKLKHIQLFLALDQRETCEFFP